MLEHPFYYTWTSQQQGQQEAKAFHCEKQEQFHFIISSGQRILNLSSISCQSCFGHHPEFIYRAIQRQWKDFSMHSAKANFALKKKISQDICHLVNLEGKIFYCVSGAEAVEHAIKMARMKTGRKVIAARKKSYHGATLGAVSLTGDWRGKIPLTVDEWTLRLPEPDSDPEGEQADKIIRSYGPEKIAAICLETITAVNGVVVPKSSWYQKIQNLCDEFGIKLIVDEVACGLYRTGKAFAFHYYPELRPHFVCMAKALTGGVFPFGAIWTDVSVAEYFQKNVLCSGMTHYAHPLGLAATGAVLEHFKEKSFQEKFSRMEKKFADELEKIRRISKVKAVQYKGLMGTIDWVGHASWTDFLSYGLYMMVREGQLFIAPPFNLEKDILQEGMEQLKKGLQELD